MRRATFRPIRVAWTTARTNDRHGARLGVYAPEAVPYYTPLRVRTPHPDMVTT